MKAELHIGTTASGRPFMLPADLGDKKIAMLAQSKKGKTYGLGDILEELAKAQRPFIATDPANNLWGLRVLPDGSPSGLKVVVIGGDHADIPFEKEAGERMAEALLATPICAVIDVAFESMGSVRRFMGDFAARLMRTKPEIPRVIVLEEAPVLIPQKCRGPQMEICKAAVSKLATIGGNFGYGVIPASQRAATMDKDVLSQCEGLIVMGMTHAADRHTVKEWIEAKGIEEQVSACFKELGSLKPGEAWYWNPSDDVFQRFTFRKRKTLHPREMHRLGLKASEVKLGDMQAFVDRVKRDLSKTQAAVVVPDKGKEFARKVGKALDYIEPKIEKIEAQTNEIIQQKDEAIQEVSSLKEKLHHEVRRRKDAERRLEAVRTSMAPQYEVLTKLFENLSPGVDISPHVDSSVYEPWLEKARKRGCGKMLEELLKKPELTRHQLGILAGVPPEKSTFRAYMAWLKRAGLVEVDGDTIRLRAV
jgi:uncharacterized protein